MVAKRQRIGTQSKSAKNNARNGKIGRRYSAGKGMQSKNKSVHRKIQRYDEFRRATTNYGTNGGCKIKLFGGEQQNEETEENAKKFIEELEKALNVKKQKGEVQK